MIDAAKIFGVADAAYVSRVFIMVGGKFGGHFKEFVVCMSSEGGASSSRPCKGAVLGRIRALGEPGVISRQKAFPTKAVNDECEEIGYLLARRLRAGYKSTAKAHTQAMNTGG